MLQHSVATGKCPTQGDLIESAVTAVGVTFETGASMASDCRPMDVDTAEEVFLVSVLFCLASATWLHLVLFEAHPCCLLEGCLGLGPGPFFILSIGGFLFV